MGIESMSVMPASKPEQENDLEPEVIIFSSINGTQRRTEHPSIVDDPSEGNNGLWKSADRVHVRLAGEEEEMTFDEYLQLLGISYGQYFKFAKTLESKGQTDQHKVLLEAHRASIKQRTERALLLHRRFTAEHPERDNRQQETAKAHSPLFTRMINELQINGLRVKPAPNRDDYLEGIDEFLELDPTSLRTSGEETGHKYYFGIQRSFENKHDSVAADPIRFIPEETDKGLVFRVFIKEDPQQYVEGFSPRDQESRWQKLLDARTEKARAAGMSPRQYAQSQPNFGLPPVSTVLRGGKREQKEKALQVLEAVSAQLNAFLSSDNASNQSDRVRFILERYRKEAGIDEFAKAIEGGAASKAA